MDFRSLWLQTIRAHSSQAGRGSINAPTMNTLARVAVVVLSLSLCATSVPPAKCRPAMDEYCNGPALQRCISVIKSKGGAVPLVALLDSTPKHAAAAWRCYSPTALNADRTAYSPASKSGLLCTTPALGSVLETCLHPPPPTKLVLLEDAARDLGAVCLDGSPAALYLRPGAETKKWHVHLEGVRSPGRLCCRCAAAQPLLASDPASPSISQGGWCFHDPPVLPEDVQCHYRAYSPTPIESRTPPRYLGSSAMLSANFSTDTPRSLESQGFLSASPANNPLFHNHSFAFVHYCDGASCKSSHPDAALAPPLQHSRSSCTGPSFPKRPFC